MNQSIILAIAAQNTLAVREQFVKSWMKIFFIWAAILNKYKIIIGKNKKTTNGVSA